MSRLRRRLRDQYGIEANTAEELEAQIEKSQAVLRALHGEFVDIERRMKETP
jgi:hypothetical protein